MRLNFENLQQEWLNKELANITTKQVLLRDFACFDIEVTNEVYFEVIDLSLPVMYSWAFQLPNVTILGRKWSEFVTLIDWINKYLNTFKAPKRLNIFVHNLTYEGSFLKNLLDKIESFKIKNRYLWMKYDRVNFVCSYMISGMNLKSFTKGCEHAKLSGEDFDYSLERLPSTDLSELELNYIINDVLGQREAINRFIKIKGLSIDNFGTNPGNIKTKSKLARKMLSDAKKVYDKAKKDKGKSMDNAVSDDFLSDSYSGKDYDIDYDTQLMLSFATHGGNVCPAKKFRSAFYEGETDDITIENVYCYDIVSAYTSYLLGCKFPVGKWQWTPALNRWDILKPMLGKKAFLGKVTFKNIRLKNHDEPIPYIPKGKHIKKNSKNCKWYIKRRLEKADIFQACVTDIDLQIIEKMYDWDDIIIEDARTCEYGFLPRWFRETVLKQYQYVYSLPKGSPERSIEKIILHSFYTAGASDPINPRVIKKGDDEFRIKERNESEYKDSIKYRDVRYDWYTWAVNWCRYYLQQAIDIAGDKTVYVGVDSIKTYGSVDFYSINKEAFDRTFWALTRTQIMEEKLDTLGCFKLEYIAKRFKVLNSVMYVCEFDRPVIEMLSKDELEQFYEDVKWAKKELNFTDEDVKNMNILITVSGLDKFRGSMQLYKEGGLEVFRKGYDFIKVPRIVPYQVDLPLCTLKYNGEDVEVCGGTILKNEYGFVLGDENWDFLNSYSFARELEEVKISEYRQQRIF